MPPKAGNVISKDTGKVTETIDNAINKVKDTVDNIVNKVDDAINKGGSGTKIKGKDIIFGSEAKSAEKLANQIAKRGWTKDLIMDTVDNSYTIRTSINRATGNTATVYYTKQGSYIIIDDVTKAVVQVSDNINPSSWVPDSNIVDPYIPK